MCQYELFFEYNIFTILVGPEASMMGPLSQLKRIGAFFAAPAPSGHILAREGQNKSSRRDVVHTFPLSF